MNIARGTILFAFSFLLLICLMACGTKQASQSSNKGFEEKGTSSQKSSALEYNTASFELTEKEKTIYQEYAKRKSDDILKDLDPIIIYKLFAHAVLQKDYETQYALLIKGEGYKTPDSFDKYMKQFKDGYNNLEIGVNRSKRDFKTLEECYREKNKVTYEFTSSEGWELGVTLVKDNKGIWKMSWFPFAT